MIYWFSGDSTQEKTTLGKKIFELLKTEKRNWRRSVFYIDEVDLNSSEILALHTIIAYIHKSGYDIVVCSNQNTAPTKDIVNKTQIQEFFLEKKSSEPTITSEDVFRLDISKSNLEHSFNKIVNFLTENDKL